MRIKDMLISIWAIISGIIIFSIIIFLIGYIFFKGYKVINFEFLFDVPRGLRLGQEGGIAPAIVGSFISSGIATIISSLLGIITSIHLNFYEKSKKRKEIINFVIKTIGGIPSIVLGLFGYTVFTLYFGFGRSIISGSLTLAIMIFPAIEMRIDRAFKEFDKNLILASYSLGVSKSYTIWKIIIPMCKESILSSFSLGYGYSIGATAPIMFCMAVVNSPVTLNITKPTMSLSYHLYILMTQGISEEMAYGTAFVLLFIIILIIIFSTFIGKNRR